MRVLTRRTLFTGPIGALAVAAYGVGIEPLLLTRVTQYRVCPVGWPSGLEFSIAIIADLHACKPWMTATMIDQIVRRTNALNADVAVLLGDYVAGHNKVTGPMANEEWAEALSPLRARLGVFAILGNHDWWADPAAQSARRGPIAARKALERVGIPVLENESVSVLKEGRSIRIAGLGDQWAFGVKRYDWSLGEGMDDLPGLLAGLDGEDPIILLAHEPDIFPSVPDRVALTFAGHTHGGQIRLFGYAPVVPSRFGRRYLYGHYCEGGRQMIVSGGLGCTVWPVRIGSPPEIVSVIVRGGVQDYRQPTGSLRANSAAQPCRAHPVDAILLTGPLS